MSFLGRWMWGAMRWLGLYQMRGTVVFLGLDSAGKTTLMRLLSEDRVMQHMPTQKPTMEEFTLFEFRFFVGVAFVAQHSIPPGNEILGIPCNAVAIGTGKGSCRTVNEF